MAYSAQQIADAYRATVGAGQMSEAQFVERARNEFGVSDGQLNAARNVVLGAPESASWAEANESAGGGLIAGAARPDSAWSSARGIADLYQREVGGGRMSEAQFVQMARANGVPDTTAGNTLLSSARDTVLNDRFSSLGNQITSLTGSRDDLQNRFNALQQRYDELERRQRQQRPGGGGIVGGTLVDPGSTTTLEAPATTGPVYGPDGRMYSSVAAALAAGVTNYSFVRPTRSGTGLINGADTMASPPAATGNVNPGTQVTGAAQQTFNFGPPRVRLPGGLRNPWSA